MFIKISICSRHESLKGGLCNLAWCDLPVNVFNNYAIEGYFERCVVVNDLIPCTFICLNCPPIGDNES